MASLATYDDFKAIHGDVGDSDRITSLLAGATALIRNESSALTDDWADDAENADDLDAVKLVCVQVAYRAWINPDAIARQQLGEHAVTYRGDDQSDALWLTANERRIVRRAANGGASITSISLETPYSGGLSRDLGDLAE